MSTQKVKKIDETIPRFLLIGKKNAEKKLKEFTTKQFNQIRNRWPDVSDLIPPIKDYLNRKGKRIRPTLTVASYKGYSNKRGNNIYLPAIGTELLHTSFIVYDDIYDDMPNLNETRGGKKVLQDIYYEKFSGLKPGDSNWEPKLFSQHAAMVAVNILLTMGATAIQESDFSDDLKNRAISLYWDTVKEGYIGQGMDILSKSKLISRVTEEEIREIELARSAAYTIKFPLLLGAIMAGEIGAQLKILSSYAYQVGLAYQIHDDILGIFGEASDTGKVQAELAEGKRTLLIQKALQMGNKQQRKILDSLMKNNTQTSKQAELAKGIIKNCGALEEVVKIGNLLVENAKAELPKLKANKQFKYQLNQLADFVLHREK